MNELLKLDGVSVLVNLINDEEDDDLSNKAYQVRFDYWNEYYIVFGIYGCLSCTRVGQINYYDCVEKIENVERWAMHHAWCVYE